MGKLVDSTHPRSHLVCRIIIAAENMWRCVRNSAQLCPRIAGTSAVSAKKNRSRMIAQDLGNAYRVDTKALCSAGVLNEMPS